MWRPRGQRGLSARRSGFITLARASPRRRGLRSRGPGSPLTMSPCLSPAGPAWPCHSICPAGSRRVFAGVSFRERALESPKCPKKVARIPMPLHRTPWWRLRHLGRGHQQASFCNGKRGQGSQIAPSHQALRLPASRAEDRPPNCTRGWWRGGCAGGRRTRPGGPVPGAGRALHLSPRAPAPPGPHRGGSPAQPSEALGPQPARRAPGTRSSRAPAGRTGSSPSPPPPPRRVGEARRAGNRGRQHLELPRRVISTGWERSVF